MKRTTVFAEEDLILEAKHLAAREGRTLTAVVQDALREYIARHRPPRHISFAGIGRSGNPLTSEEMDDLLRAGADRAEGWSPERRNVPTIRRT